MILRILSVLLFVILGLGCSPRGRTPQDNKLKAYDFGEDFRRNSCQVRWNEGAPAPSQLPSSREALSFFGKVFDFSRLEVVGFLSPAGVADLIGMDGVGLYTMPLLQKGACAGLRPIPLAPKPLQELWKERASDNVLGAYFPLSWTREFGETQPAILVRQDTDGYTLAHEYLHSVYDSMRISRQILVDDLISDYERASQQMEMIGPFPDQMKNDKAMVQRYLKAWLDYNEMVVELLVIFPLEEVAIEALMQEAANRGEFHSLSLYNRVNSALYIQDSADVALQELQNIQSQALVNRTLALRHELSELAKRSATLRDRSMSLWLEARQVKIDHTEILRRLKDMMVHGLISPLSVDRETQHECGHAERYRRIRGARGAAERSWSAPF